MHILFVNGQTDQHTQPHQIGTPCAEVVKSTIQLYEDMSAEMLPTPAKSQGLRSVKARTLGGGFPNKRWENGKIWGICLGKPENDHHYILIEKGCAALKWLLSGGCVDVRSCLAQALGNSFKTLPNNFTTHPAHSDSWNGGIIRPQVITPSTSVIWRRQMIVFKQPPLQCLYVFVHLCSLYLYLCNFQKA